MSTGTAVATGDLITAAKMNLKLEDLSNDEENTTFAYLRFRASGTLPAGTTAYIGRDNTNDVTINALSTGSINLAIAGTDEYTFDATALTIVAGNRVDHNAAAGAWAVLLADVNDNELLEIFPTALAVNHLGVRNAATGGFPRLSARGSDTNVGLEITDNNDNELLRLRAVASAVTEVAMVSAATGARPIIRSEGEADRGLVLASYDGTNSEEILILAATASAVNEITITSAATGGRPQIEASGDDTNIGITYMTKGTGQHVFDTGTDPVTIRLMGAAGGWNNVLADTNGNELLELQGVASAVNHVGVLSAVTGASPQIVARGDDTNISLFLTPKGSGSVVANVQGSASVVALAINGDTNTGFFARATDVVSIAAGGSQVAEFAGVGLRIGATASHATTAGTNIITIAEGTAPVGTITDAGSIYVRDAAGVTELTYIDSGGTVSNVT